MHSLPIWHFPPGLYSQKLVGIPVNTQIWNLRAKCYSSGAWFASMNMQQHELLAWDFCPVLGISVVCKAVNFPFLNWTSNSGNEFRAGEQTIEVPSSIFFLLQNFTLVPPVPELFSCLSSGKIDMILLPPPALRFERWWVNYLIVVNCFSNTLLRKRKTNK